MAYAITSGSVVQMTLRGILFDQVVMTTFHYRLDLTGPLANGGVALDDINTQLQGVGNMLDDYSAAMPPEWVSDDYDLQWIYPLRFVKRTYTNGFPNGTGIGTTMTNASAALLVRGEAATKRSVATKHLPGVGGGSINAGMLSGAYLAGAGAIKAQVQANVVAAGRTYTPIIWGRPRAAFTKCGRDFPALDPLYTPITNAVLQDTARVQRRRTVGLGI